MNKAVILALVVLAVLAYPATKAYLSPADLQPAIDELSQAVAQQDREALIGMMHGDDQTKKEVLADLLLSQGSLAIQGNDAYLDFMRESTQQYAEYDTQITQTSSGVHYILATGAGPNQAALIGQTLTLGDYSGPNLIGFIQAGRSWKLDTSIDELQLSDSEYQQTGHIIRYQEHQPQLRFQKHLLGDVHELPGDDYVASISWQEENHCTSPARPYTVNTGGEEPRAFTQYNVSCPQLDAHATGNGYSHYLTQWRMQNDEHTYRGLQYHAYMTG